MPLDANVRRTLRYTLLVRIGVKNGLLPLKFRVINFGLFDQRFFFL